MQKYKIYYLVFFILCFYIAFSLWRFSFMHFDTCYDGYWHHKVARNIVLGKGAVINAVLQFYPRPEQILHKAGEWWTPLSFLILSASYKIFGINDIGARAAALFLDAILCMFIFWISLQMFKSYPIAVFSSLIFTVHSFTVSARISGGASEGFHYFIVTLLCYCIYQAMKNEKYILLAGFVGGISYLVRNESIWSIFVIILSFLYIKYIAKKDYHVSWKYLAYALMIFIVTISPWEIRNYILYGKGNNWSKYNVIFATEYYDMFNYNSGMGLTWYIKHYLSLGLKRIIEVKIQSYYYKLDTAIQILTWPLGLFIIPGIMGTIKKIQFYPVYAYFAITYIMMGFLNSAPQGAGWHGVDTLLPYFIIICVSGCFYFTETIVQQKKTAKILGIILASFIVMYYVLDSYRLMKKIQRGHIYFAKNYADVVDEGLKKILKRGEKPVIMTHVPHVLHFFLDIPAVQIPTNEQIETVEEVIKKYSCNILVLYGHIPSVFAKLYSGDEKIQGFTLSYEKTSLGVPLEGAGDKVRIYKIDASSWAKK